MRLYEPAIKSYQACLKIQPNFSLAFYNLACAYSLQSKTIDAGQWMEKAFANGWTDVEAVRSDPDLVNLRNTQAFVLLMKKYDPNSRPSDDPMKRTKKN